MALSEGVALREGREVGGADRSISALLPSACRQVRLGQRASSPPSCVLIKPFQQQGGWETRPEAALAGSPLVDSNLGVLSVLVKSWGTVHLFLKIAAVEILNTRHLLFVCTSVYLYLFTGTRE